MSKASYFRYIFCETLHRKYSGITVCKLPTNINSNHEIKKENAKILRRYNEENKSLFGGLVETLPQKRKREKRAPPEEESEFPVLENDRLEEVWWRQNSPVEITSSPKSLCETGDFTSRKVDVSTKISNFQDSVNLEDGKVSVNHCYIPVNESCKRLKQSDDKRDVDIIFHKSNIRLPEIMVRNLSKFPLDQKNKKLQREFKENVPECLPILSIPMKEENDSQKNLHLEYPSVSKILNATMSDTSRAALQRWKENMIAELGEEGFNKYKTALLEHGRMFHNNVQKFLSGESQEEIFVDPAVEGCWHSLESTLKEISSVRALESHVVHHQLLYHGIIDCVASYKGKPMLIEWKKSTKKKLSLWNTYDAPVQVAAYLGAMNFDPNYNLKVRGGLVVVAYTDGSPASVHQLNLTKCQIYWQLWLKRLQLYWDLINKNDVNNVPNVMSL